MGRYNRIHTDRLDKTSVSGKTISAGNRSPSSRDHQLGVEGSFRPNALFPVSGASSDRRDAYSQWMLDVLNEGRVKPLMFWSVDSDMVRPYHWWRKKLIIYWGVISRVIGKADGIMFTGCAEEGAGGVYHWHGIARTDGFFNKRSMPYSRATGILRTTLYGNGRLRAEWPRSDEAVSKYCMKAAVLQRDGLDWIEPTVATPGGTD